jgi:hypothetical protein
VPCEGVTPYPLQVWTSDAASSFGVCIADCEAGVSFGEVLGGKCDACTVRTCALGEWFRDCAVRSDSACIPCTQAGYAALAGNEVSQYIHLLFCFRYENAQIIGLCVWQEYMVGGLCTARCATGYYRSGSACVVCDGLCPAGQNQTTYCIETSARKSPPSCQACPQTLAENQVWAVQGGGRAPCSVACVGAYVWFAPNASCVLCAPSLCQVGQEGVCTNSWSGTYYDCAPCASPLRVHEVYVGPGVCTKACEVGYEWSAVYERCMAVDATTSTATTTPPPPTNADSSGLIYPRRGMRHSALP